MRLGVNGRFYGARATGVQRFARELTARLGPRVDELAVFVPAGISGPEELPGEARVVQGARGGLLWEQWELPRRARAEGVDVLLHPANAAPLLGYPGVVVVHDLLPLSHPELFRPAYRIWARVAHAGPARRARAVITVSSWSAGEIARLAGIPRERISVVRQGVGPLDAPASAEAVATVLGRLGLQRPYFLGVAGGDARKGMAFLRSVWRLLGPDAPADLVSVGGTYGAVHARGDGSAPEARALGHVSDGDLGALYTGALALLYPSSAEGFGRPPLEALACGTRVLVAPYGPAGEVLGTAADVLPREPEAWVGGVRRLMAESPEERSARVERGRAWADGYSWEEAADQVVQVCRSAVGATP